MAINKVIIVYGGELANDVAKQVEARSEGLSNVQIVLRNASEKPKELLEHSRDTAVCFIIQTIENASPTEDVSFIFCYQYLISLFLAKFINSRLYIYIYI